MASTSGLEVTAYADVRREARIAAAGFALVGLAFVPVLLQALKVTSLGGLAGAGAAALPGLVGGALVAVGLGRAARRTGWTLLVEGVYGWLLFTVAALAAFGAGGWSMMLQWVGLAGDNAPEILYGVVEAVIGMIALFLAVTGVSASLILVGNLFGGRGVVGSADFAAKVAAALSFTVYPLAAIAAAYLTIAAVLATSPARLPVREAVLGGPAQP